MPSIKRLHFVAAPLAQALCEEFKKHYGQYEPQESDAIVVLGGDGFLLHSIQLYRGFYKPFYGIHQGRVGFMMNTLAIKDLYKCLQTAEYQIIPLLKIYTWNHNGAVNEAFAMNEVSLFRKSRQAMRARVFINNVLHLDELVCDGLLLATPSGSTAYNASANGPILHFGTNLLALTPIAPFRPRRWGSILIPQTANVTLDILDAYRRPVNTIADTTEIPNVIRMDAHIDPNTTVTLLFNACNNAIKRVLHEQFNTKH